MKKLTRLLLFGLCLGLTGGASVPTVHAKTHVFKITKVKAKTYHTTVKGRTVYTSTSLKKARTHLKKHANVTVTKQARLKHNGKNAIYYYVHNSKIKGWIWHGHLKTGKYNAEVAYIQANRKEFADTMNKERQQLHRAKYKFPKAYQKLAQQRANDMKKLGPNATGNDYAYKDNRYTTYLEVEAPKYGLDSTHLSEDTFLLGGGIDTGLGYVIPSKGLVSQSKKILSAKTTKLGYGLAEGTNDMSYTCVIYNHK